MKKRIVLILATDCVAKRSEELDCVSANLKDVQNHVFLFFCFSL